MVPFGWLRRRSAAVAQPPSFREKWEIVDVLNFEPLNFKPVTLSEAEVLNSEPLNFEPSPLAPPSPLTHKPTP